jgi:hypothetical protein
MTAQLLGSLDGGRLAARSGGSGLSLLAAAP